eukprot:2155971-Rhodomonas_salina.2
MMKAGSESQSARQGTDAGVIVALRPWRELSALRPHARCLSPWLMGHSPSTRILFDAGSQRVGGESRAGRAGGSEHG